MMSRYGELLSASITVLGIILLIAAFFAVPFGVIFALNTLFQCEIPYRWDTYLSVVLLRFVLADTPTTTTTKTTV
jgi:hypothetical protein